MIVQRVQEFVRWEFVVLGGQRRVCVGCENSWAGVFAVLSPQQACMCRVYALVNGSGEKVVGGCIIIVVDADDKEGWLVCLFFW